MNEFDPMPTTLELTQLSGTGIDLKSGRDIQVQVVYDDWLNMLFLSVGYSGSQ